jgi:hypothetical protein
MPVMFVQVGELTAIQFSEAKSTLMFAQESAMLVNESVRSVWKTLLSSLDEDKYSRALVGVMFAAFTSFNRRNRRPNSPSEQFRLPMSVSCTQVSESPVKKAETLKLPTTASPLSNVRFPLELHEKRDELRGLSVHKSSLGVGSSMKTLPPIVYCPARTRGSVSSRIKIGPLMPGFFTTSSKVFMGE